MAVTTTIMAEQADTRALLRLVTWLSPAFPVGSFAYSGGLEQAVADGHLTRAEDLRLWLETLLTRGAMWNDALLLAEGYEGHGDPERLKAASELAEAMAASSERRMETVLQGEAFLAAARNWPSSAFELLGPVAAYPVAVGAVAGAHRTGLRPTLAAYLGAAVTNAVSAAIRCGVIGQRDGVGVLAALENTIAAVTDRAAQASLDELSSATIMADISSLRHETLYTRLFRS